MPKTSISDIRINILKKEAGVGLHHEFQELTAIPRASSLVKTWILPLYRNRRLIQRFIEIILVVASILVLLQSNRETGSERSAKEMRNLSLDQIVLFGDSITQHSFNPEIQGWGATVAHAYMRKLDVINRGYSGYNTLWAKEILASTIKSTLSSGDMTRSPKIKLMTLFLGANDAVLPTVNPRQHVSLPDYKKYLHEMLEIIRLESPGTKVVIITPPPVDPSVWGAKCLGKGNQPDRTVEHTRLYRDACVQVGLEAKSKWGSDLVLVDIWTVFFGTESGVNEGGFTYSMDQVSDLLSDGLHLAAKGNQLLGAAVLKAIKESWPELSPEILVPRVIFHDQVDANDLPGCLFRNA